MRALLLLAFSPLLVFGQPVIEVKPVKFFTEVGTAIGTSTRTPFWLRANQYGIVPSTLPYGTFRTGAQMDYRSRPLSTPIKPRLKDTFGWGYGAEVVVNSGPTNTRIVLPEAYVKGRLGPFELMAGRRREVIGLADSTIGSGSYVWSGNALPLPKIQVSIPEYTPIGFTKGILAIRGQFAHGWFESAGFVQHSLLHQKSLYGRLGKPTWPVRFYAGINHQAQWGGTTRQDLPELFVKNGVFPSRLKDYMYVVTGQSLGYFSLVDTTYYSKFDRENRIGNHMGTIDLGMEIGNRRYSVFLYRQSIYEDGSLFYLINIQDGLNGIRFRNLRPSSSVFQIRDVVVEYLHTMSQGGGTFQDLAKMRGKDNYFNHGQYRDGWSYYGRTLGTPFIPPASDTRPNLPPYGFTNNNRVRALHLGVSGGMPGGGSFALKASVSDNFGTYDNPFPPNTRQLSSALTVSQPISYRRDWIATATIAHDQGDLYPQSTAIYAGVRKTWEYYRYRVRGK